MTRRAFTLVELLVVVAVLALLLGILLPSLGRARRGAWQVQCLSNVRQLQTASDLYANDHDGRFMPGAEGIASANLRRWHGTRANAGEPFTPARAPITPYLTDSSAGSAASRACPSFTPRAAELRESSAGFELSSGGYGYNNAFVGVERQQIAPGAWSVASDATGAQRARFRSPARTVSFGDAALAADQLIEYSFIEPPFWPDFPGARPDPSTHFRHDGGAGIAWLDGHATSESRTFTQASGVYTSDPATLGTGWFGDAMSNTLYDYD